MQYMVKTLIGSIIAGIAGLWLAMRFTPWFSDATVPLQKLLIGGAVLGIVIAILRPFVNFIATSILFLIGVAITLFLLK
ncbi:MAG: hypothetical protein HYS52_00350 [Candidatus Wildermuthbacteria bacterium]|nr:hypothetical protein [Candidatus Wildermuthbacteria bacterium]